MNMLLLNNHLTLILNFPNLNIRQVYSFLIVFFLKRIIRIIYDQAAVLGAADLLPARPGDDRGLYNTNVA